MSVGIDFTPRNDVPLWQTVLAWIALLALLFCYMRYCVKPALKPFADHLRQQQQQKEKP